MRILVASDLHYTLKQLDWVVGVAGDYDLVVLAGDHLDISSIVEPGAQIAVMLEYFKRIASKTTAVACSGNHDLDAHNALDERAAVWLEAAGDTGVFTDGSRVETDELVITVCPWWDGPRTREAVDRQLAADAEHVDGRTWIWVYHAPPDDSPTSWTGKRHYGDEYLNAWIEQHRPTVVLCGHVHTSPWMSDGGWQDRIGSTTVLNAGRQPGPIPSHIELDTEAGTMRWFSYDGSDERSLAPSESRDA